MPQNFPLNIKTALAISAHPDDAEYYAGGTIFSLARKGIKIIGLYATSGEKGNYALIQKAKTQGKVENHTPKQLAELREKDTKDSNKRLGISNSYFLKIPDGELVNQRNKLVEQICLQVRKLKPDLIFTFDPWKRYELHPDHRAISFAGLDALLASENNLFYPDQLSDKITPHKVSHILLYHSDRPNISINISREILDKKIESLLAYKTQYLDKAKISQEVIENARDQADKSGEKFCEIFHYIRSL